PLRGWVPEVCDRSAFEGSAAPAQECAPVGDRHRVGMGWRPSREALGTVLKLNVNLVGWLDGLRGNSGMATAANRLRHQTTRRSTRSGCLEVAINVTEAAAGAGGG